MKAIGIVAMLSVLLTLGACGGGSMSNTTPPPQTFTIGGTVTGLAGSGLVLQNNGGNNLAVKADGKFTFTTAVNSGTSYKVTVMTQPASPTQTCAVAGGTGTASGNVTDVAVACTTNSYTIGGTITGLAGTGLKLQNNSGDTLSVSGHSFTFATAIKSGATYSVTVSAQPSSPWQTCAVTGGNGTAASANVTNVAVNCTTNSYTIGGTITGLAGAGLKLQNNSGDTLSVSGSSFTFPTSIKSNATYKVSVLAQPTSPWQTCAVTSGSGTATSANVTDVAVTCTTNSYMVSGTVTGLMGSPLQLQNGVDTLNVISSGSFQFVTSIASEGSYNVSVSTQPINPWQTCGVTGGSGKVTNANVTNVVVSCTTNAYTLGGTVTGLLGSGLVLRDNLGDITTLTANTNFSQGFTLNSKVTSGTTYTVTIQTQPSSPAQTCYVGMADGSNTGKVQAANIASVQIGCSNLWAYEKGPELLGGQAVINANGSYGLQGVYGTGTPGNLPGGRYSASSWTDTSGNYWLFGGYGFDSGNTSAGNLNDLWEYSPSMSQWRWVAGSKSRNQKGVYSGTPYPGARDAAVTWTDASGNFWLFGGFGYDSGTGAAGDLNDLWKYDPTTNTWTYVSGSNLVNQLGVYSGTEVPGARDSAVGWIDGSGNLWLFGGEGCDSVSCPDPTAIPPTTQYLNDLWEFNTGTSTWTWVKGANLANQPGLYGILSKAASTNVPGSRFSSVSWIDKSGNLWLLGGFGKDGDTPTNTAELNDLWEYNSGTNEWTWMGGSHIGAASGNYSANQTVAASTNVPGARQGALGWTDASGNFWMFGGLGFDSNNLSHPSELNDLWKYDVSTGWWAWMSGSTTNGATGLYGAPETPDPVAEPGARGGSSGWIDSSGNLLLFGGNGPISVSGSFNDLWEFRP